MPKLNQIRGILSCVKVAQVQIKYIIDIKDIPEWISPGCQKSKMAFLWYQQVYPKLPDRQIDWEADIKQNILNWKVNVTVSNGEKQSLSGLWGELVGHDEGNFDQRHVDKIVNSDVQHQTKDDQEQVLQEHGNHQTGRL